MNTFITPKGQRTANHEHKLLKLPQKRLRWWMGLALLLLMAPQGRTVAQMVNNAADNFTIPPNRFTTAPSPSIIPLPTQSGGIVSWTPTGENFEHYHGEPSTYGHNLMVENGQLKCFFVDGRVFDGQGYVIGKPKFLHSQLSSPNPIRLISSGVVGTPGNTPPADIDPANSDNVVLGGNQVFVFPKPGGAPNVYWLLTQGVQQTTSIGSSPNTTITDKVFLVEIDLSLPNQRFAGRFGVLRNPFTGSTNSWDDVAVVLPFTTVGSNGFNQASIRNSQIGLSAANPITGNRRVVFQDGTNFQVVLLSGSGASLEYQSQTGTTNLVGMYNNRSKMALIETPTTLHIAFSGSQASSNAGTNAKGVFLVDYATNGPTPSPTNIAFVNTPGLNEDLPGVEFSPNGQYVYYNKNVNLLQSPMVPCFGRIDRCSASPVADPMGFTPLAIQQNYKNSFIQMGRDGKLYVIRNNKIARIENPNNAAGLAINELTTASFSYNPSNGFNPGSGTGASAADYSRYQLPAQPANYLSNVSSQTICSGNPVVLDYTDAPAGATITWVGSDGSSFTGNPVTVYPTTNTLYTAYITGASTCSYLPPSIAVFIQNASVSIVPSSGANCALLTQSYSLSGNFPSGSTIQWTASGGTAVGPSNGTTFTVDWGNSPGNNLSVSVSVVDPQTGCTSSAQLSLRPCCPIEPGMVYLNGTNTPIDASTVAWVPGQSYALDGSMVVPAGSLVVLNNVHLAMDVPGNIYIEPNATLTVTGASLLEARCDTLWQGITVAGSQNLTNPTGPYGYLIVDGLSTIKDAETAVFSRKGGRVKLENALLRLNYKGVVLKDFNNLTVPSGADYFSMVGTEISSLDANQIHTHLLAPHIGESGLVGIEIQNVQTTTIGEFTQQQDNDIEFMRNGVVAVNSDLRVNRLNVFETLIGLNKPTPYPVPSGTGIGMFGSSETFKTLTVGSDVSGPPDNTIRGVVYGIYCEKNVRASVYKLIIDTALADGIRFWKNRIPNLVFNVRSCAVKHFSGAGISLAASPRANFGFQDNYLLGSKDLTGPFAFGTGISVGATKNVRETMFGVIASNLIDSVKNGILAYNLSPDAAGQPSTIQGNSRILLNAEPYVGSASYGVGILVNSGNQVSVYDNNLYAAHQDNWWVDGIRVKFSYGTRLGCNFMSRTASGVFFDGACPATHLANNGFRRNYWGLLLNGTVLGPQVLLPNTTVEVASNNKWIGDYGSDPALPHYWHTSLQPGTPLGNSHLGLAPNQVGSGSGTVYKPLPFWAEGSGGVSFLGLVPSETDYTELSTVSFNTTGCGLGPVAVDWDSDEPFSIKRMEKGVYTTDGEVDGDAWWTTYQRVQAKGYEGLTTSLVDSLQQSALTKLADVSAGMAETAIEQASWWAQLKALNQSVMPQTQHEINWKALNEVALAYSKTFSDSLATFDAMQWATYLQQLASECPKEAGPAVFTARQMVTLFGLDATSTCSDCEIPSSVGGQARGLTMESADWAESVNEIPLEERMNETLTQTEALVLTLMPNPAHDEAMVLLPQHETFKQVQAFDASGRLLSINIKPQTPNRVLLDMSQLARGLYLIRVETTQGFYQEKLIKE